LNKVLFCYPCGQAPLGKEVNLVLTEGKDPVPCCPWCLEKLGKIESTKLDESGHKSNLIGKIIGDELSPRSYAFRTFNSPHGFVRLNLSTTSVYCNWAGIDGNPVPLLRDWVNEGFETAIRNKIENRLGPCEVLLEYIRWIADDAQRRTQHAVELELPGFEKEGAY
jgi:hypothetical protein